MKYEEKRFARFVGKAQKIIEERDRIIAGHKYTLDTYRQMAEQLIDYWDELPVEVLPPIALAICGDTEIELNKDSEIYRLVKNKAKMFEQDIITSRVMRDIGWKTGVAGK